MCDLAVVLILVYLRVWLLIPVFINVQTINNKGISIYCCPLPLSPPLQHSSRSSCFFIPPHTHIYTHVLYFVFSQSLPQCLFLSHTARIFFFFLPTLAISCLFFLFLPFIPFFSFFFFFLPFLAICLAAIPAGHTCGLSEAKTTRYTGSVHKHCLNLICINHQIKAEIFLESSLKFFTSDTQSETLTMFSLTLPA